MTNLIHEKFNDLKQRRNALKLKNDLNDEQEGNPQKTCGDRWLLKQNNREM